MGKFSCYCGFLSTANGILKLLELIFSAASMGMMIWYTNLVTFITQVQLFHYLISVGFVMMVTLELISCLTSKDTAKAFPASNYAIYSNFSAAVLFLSAGIAVLVQWNNIYWSNYWSGSDSSILIAAGSLALCSSLIFCANAIVALKQK